MTEQQVEQLVDEVWDNLRDVAAVTKRQASTVVLVNKEKIRRMVNRLAIDSVTFAAKEDQK